MHKQRNSRRGRQQPGIEPNGRTAKRPLLIALEALEERRLLSIAVASVGAQDVPSGKSLLIPVSASDDVPISYGVSSNTPGITATLLTGNTFLQLNVANYGSMTFELFNNFAPNTVAQITKLVNQGFYNGLTFWRVVNGFMAQGGGSPTGSGSYPASGTLPEFNNEPNLDAIFSGSGQLAMANAGTNTNTEQFFVTDGPQRSLDYLYTLFGQLVSGSGVLTSILQAAVTNQSVGSSTEDSKPVTPIVITSAQIVQDTSDAVILITDPGKLIGASSSANITLTATDSNGGSEPQTFTVTGVDDTANNDPPFITSLNLSPTTPLNTQIDLYVGGVDADGDPMEILTSSSPTGVTLATDNNDVVVTPNSGFSGTVQFEVAVSDSAHLSAIEQNGTGYIDVVSLTVQSQLPATISNGVLTVNGTGGADTMTIDLQNGQYLTSVNGNTQTLSATGVTSVVVNGLAGNDIITLGSGMVNGASVQGGPGDDSITGGPGNDTLAGGQGNDTILGAAGDDEIHGGQGDDSLAGGKGNDTILGGQGNDTLRGALGDDSLNGGAGTNQFYGGQGNNIFYAVNGTADELFVGAATNDSLIYGSSDNYIIESGTIPPGNITLA
jgi:cyclophilin family peptidyl-prolyl cis-trans isomerase